MASDSPEKKPLDPDAVTLSSDKLFPYQDGQGPLQKISARWLRRRQAGGGRKAPQQPTRERSERDRTR
jgi:hypothetical protein